jgi:hypothetical protein
MLLAQSAECSCITIGRGPSIRNAFHASGRVVASGLAMGGNNRHDGCLAVSIGDDLRERGWRQWR